MMCRIQWIDLETGRATPDHNDAVALAQAFDPRMPGTTAHEWIIESPFTISNTLERYTKPLTNGAIHVAEYGWCYPICAKHIKKLPFWRYLPLPGQKEEEYHPLVKAQPPPVVIEAIVNAFPSEATRILSELHWHGRDNFWSFNMRGIFVGCEADGHLHS
jgi:hypothetical protein